ncbi:hypothetical protein NDU88_004745 [Pleurodeles waltl]|uniref:Uncharacterized protein n=1 Tax=Pleurodeles waltl TaxID=8319 RepID=A0AAV7W9F0_PLEWA|nr:hypothetical protein NDU88_004745 [Pleurodeles waltl]
MPGAWLDIPIRELSTLAGPAGLAAPWLEWRLTKEVSGGLSLLRPDRRSGQTAALRSAGPALGPCAGAPGFGSQEEASVAGRL